MKSHFHVVPVFDAITEETTFAVMFYVKYMNRNYLMKTYKTKDEARINAYNLMLELETNGFTFSPSFLAGKQSFPVYEAKTAHYSSAREFPF